MSGAPGSNPLPRSQAFTFRSPQLAARSSKPDGDRPTTKPSSSENNIIDLTSSDDDDENGDGPLQNAYEQFMSSQRSSSTKRSLDRPHATAGLSFTNYDGPKPLTLAKRPRGRPRKDGPRYPTPPPQPKKPRGRPRKYPAVDVDREESLRPPMPVSRVSDEWSVNIKASEEWMRSHIAHPFVRQLNKLPGPSVTMINTADDEPPPTNFQFIQEYVFREGTSRIDKEARYGCTCRPHNMRDVGCEFTTCECIEDAGDEEQKMGFPYHALGEKQGCLRSVYLRTRHMVYECNELCNCPSYCKNKVVSKGRKIPLDIFKTTHRGWGLRSPVDIRKGQFIDVYLGEVITDAEARRREQTSTKQKNSYLFSLDKFTTAHDVSSGSDDDSLITGDEEDLPNPDLFVVDGQHMGGPSRFINHSCDPNLRIFTVSMFRGDSRVYELAFFAIDEIKAGTELTFDYMDHDEDKGEPVEGKVRCLCGSERCRGWLWI